MAYRDSFSFGFSLTPWVKRLLIANTVVFVALWLLARFGVVGLADLLALRPDMVLYRPWTVLTYMFVHAGFLHILFNMIALFFFGPPVEERLGPNEFLKFYLLCGLGGAAFSFIFALHTMIVGASAAIYGVMLAFAIWWPDAPIYIWGILPVKAKWLVLAFVAIDLFMALSPGSFDGVAHFAHLGGAVVALVYLKAGGFAPGITARARKLFRPKLTVVQGSKPAAPKPTAHKRVVEENRMLDDLDRVLDKISHSGIASLTPEERKLLDEASRRFRQN
jgi:membrane associated rhomboid family serine protease